MTHDPTEIKVNDMTTTKHDYKFNANKTRSTTVTDYRFADGTVSRAVSGDIRLKWAQVEEWKTHLGETMHSVTMKGLTLNKDGIPKAHQIGASIRGGSHLFQDSELANAIWIAHKNGELA